MVSRDSTAPLGLPGRFTMIVRARTAVTARDKTAVGVFSIPLRRISSETPGMRRSAMATVASGVLSRGPMPVPPVVKMISARLASAMALRCSRMAAGSSGMHNVSVISQPRPRQNATTAGPEASWRSPLAAESLIVRMATRMPGSFSDLTLIGADFVAAGFVHQAHGFHQQAGSVAGGRGAIGSVGRTEVDFEFSLGPQKHTVDSVIAFHFPALGVTALAAREIKFASLGALFHDQTAGLLAHFEGLHEVDHAHFLEAALDDARSRTFGLELFEMQAINDSFCDAYEVFDEKRLGDEIFDAIDERAQAFFYVGAAGHEKKRDVASGLASAKLFKKLSAIETGHFVIAKK